MKRMITGVGSRVALLVAAAIVATAGYSQTPEGWRLDPLDAFIHAGWWSLPQQELPPKIEVWKPASRDGRTWTAYSQAAVEFANAQAGPSMVEATTAEALAAAETGLGLAPAQAAAWARLALLRANQGNRAGSGQALQLSFKVGPRHRGVTWLRCRLGLYLWEEMPVDGKAGTAADIRRLWQQPPNAK